MDFLLKKTDITIFIVEDDSINSSYLSQVITKVLPDAIVFEAPSYEDTLAILNKKNPT